MECLEQGFKVEVTRESITTLYAPDPTPEASVEPLAKFYKQNFIGKEHANYVGEDISTETGGAGGGGPVVVSFIYPSTSSSPALIPDRECGDWCKAIVRTKREDHRILIPYSTSRKEMLRAISKAIPSLQVSKWAEVKESSFVDQLVTFEESMLLSRLKFGVLLSLEGQIDENEMFGNKDPTPELEQFLSIIADKIELLGWKKFKGGLDTKSNSTGIYSYYTEYKDIEIMFHVSPLLPFQPDDLQRVERKRHIGNDIVTIIFKSGNEPFSPSTLTTKFTHIFIVVSLEKYDEAGTPYYRVAVANKPSIHPYPPYLPSASGDSMLFEGNAAFREFLLAKLINAERAALHSPEFLNKLTRTREGLLKELISKPLNK